MSSRPGFSTGESNFFIAVQKSKTKSGLSTSLRFFFNSSTFQRSLIIRKLG